MRTAIIVGAAMLALAACTTTGEIDGHQVRGTAAPETPVEQVGETVMHRHAPQWFRDGWASYVEQAEHRYAIMAVDRNMRGWGYLYCPKGQQCGWNYSARKIAEAEALKLCRENVREYQPAHRPDCAVYAIKDKIVWTGPMPWE